MMLPLLEGDVVQTGLVFRSAPPAWVIALVIVPAIVGLSWFVYRLSGDAPPAVRRVLTFLRILVLAVIAALLMNPSHETQIVDRQKTLAVVLVDVSASMDHKDDFVGAPDAADRLRAAAHLGPEQMIGAMSRLDLVKAVLDRPERRFLEELAKTHELRTYAFGESLQAVPNLGDLAAHDRSTALGAAIERVLEEPEVKSRAVGGIVVITDGKNTSGTLPDAAAEAAKRRHIPIFPIGVGDPTALRDLELVTVRADEVVLLGDEAVIDIKVRNHGFPTVPVELRLLDVKDNQPFHRENVTLVASAEDQAFTLHYRPTREGDQQWIVEVRPIPGEHSTDNNRKTIPVRVRRNKLKVLYVDGAPRWEYRKLKNFLVRGDEAYQTRCLLLSAEPLFIQEATPGIVPLQQFPQTDEDLFQYDVIIFGDVDPESDQFFPGNPAKRRAALERIRKFVENGGGFGVIAGQNSAPRSFRDTPLEDVIPVVIDATDAQGVRSDGLTQWKPRLTALGHQHPVMQLEAKTELNTNLWENDAAGLKAAYWFSKVKKAKPGARVLAVHPTERNDQGPYVIMAAGSFGDGPVFFCGTDEIWRWFYEHGPKYAHQFWGNMVRWLGRTRLYAGDKRFHLMANRSAYEVGDRITLTAYVKEKDLRPSAKPEQEIVLKSPAVGAVEQRIQLKHIDDGVFERALVAGEIGEWQAWILPEDGLTDEKISPVTFAVRSSDVERREPVLDEATLRMLATRTGGKYTDLANAFTMLEALGAETVEVPRRREFHDLRKEPWIPAIVLGLLTIEWILRKRWRYL